MSCKNVLRSHSKPVSQASEVLFKDRAVICLSRCLHLETNEQTDPAQKRDLAANQQDSGWKDTKEIVESDVKDYE